MQMTAPLHSRLPIGILLVPVVSTLFGGWIAIRCRRYLPLLMALGAGLLLGTAFLDLLPEALAIAGSTGQQPRTVLGASLLAFLSFLAIDSILHRIGRSRSEPIVRKTLGRVNGGILILHSFRDGMVIGAAYSASQSAGLIVALGIVAHDIGDGMNTVILSTAGEQVVLWDWLFLLADALAPLLGGLLTVWWIQSPGNAVLLLAVAAGFFLQMATGDLLPDLREPGYRHWFIVPAVLGGGALVYFANLLASGISK